MIHADGSLEALPNPVEELGDLSSLVQPLAPAPYPHPYSDPAEIVALRDLGDRKQVEDELRESQRAMATLMDNLPGMAYRCRNDPDWTMDFVSRGALDLTGYTSAELVANAKVSYGQLIRPEDREAVSEGVGAALQTKTPFRIVYRISPASGPEKWVWEQGCGVFADDGELQALEGFITDITEARSAEENGRRLLVEQTARLAAESAEQRAKFLSEASRILGKSFDYQTTLATLARLAVPVLGDYCVVDVLENDGDLVRVGVAHNDPAKEPLLLALSVGGSHAIPGESPPADAIIVPLVVSDRVVGAVTLVFSDSDRRYTADDLALAEELARRAASAVENARLFHDAQQATQARDHVLAIVAHDLRNPLGVVLTGSEMLLDTATENEREHIDMIVSSAQRMNQLIQDLLEVARMESGRLTVDLLPQTVEPLIAEALTMMRPLAVSRSILLESELEPELPLVLFDSARILQVISNLIGNALKFTPAHGRVCIRCGRAGGDVRFGIADTGRGVSPEQLPHIFRRFWQANTADLRGVGLGLSIAEGIVAAHGGKIWVESKSGVGSTFYFTLPSAPGESTLGPAGSRPAS